MPKLVLQVARAAGARALPTWAFLSAHSSEDCPLPRPTAPQKEGSGPADSPELTEGPLLQHPYGSPE